MQNQCSELELASRFQYGSNMLFTNRARTIPAPFILPNPAPTKAALQQLQAGSGSILGAAQNWNGAGRVHGK